MVNSVNFTFSNHNLVNIDPNYEETAFKSTVE